MSTALSYRLHRYYSSWEEAKDVGHRLEPTMFPTEEKAKLPLHRCMRFLPHHQDTGGFFVAVLEKVAELPEDFVMPKHYKSAPDSARAARAAVCAQISGKIADPVVFAKSCAEEALQAAKTAVEALAAGVVICLLSCSVGQFPLYRHGICRRMSVC